MLHLISGARYRLIGYEIIADLMNRMTRAERALVKELMRAETQYLGTRATPTTDEARRAKRRVKEALEVGHRMLDRGWRRIADEGRRARLRSKCDDIFEKLESTLLVQPV